MIDLHKILIPTDFSKFSDVALTYAVALAEKFGAELHLLHVVQDLGLIVPDAVAVAPPVFPPIDQFVQAARVAMERIALQENLKGVRLQQKILEGQPFYEIIRYAKELAIDLIVMGTHGHAGLAHVLLGSVTERVVRKAPCPVLTVRHPEHEFVHP